MKYRTLSHELPNICSNCCLASWSEEGITCHHPDAMGAQAFTLNAAGQMCVNDSPEDHAQIISAHGTCDLHQRGSTTYGAPTGPWYDALIDAAKVKHRPGLLREAAVDCEVEAMRLHQEANRAEALAAAMKAAYLPPVVEPIAEKI